MLHVLSKGCQWQTQSNLIWTCSRALMVRGSQSDITRANAESVYGLHLALKTPRPCASNGAPPARKIWLRPEATQKTPTVAGANGAGITVFTKGLVNEAFSWIPRIRSRGRRRSGCNRSRQVQHAPGQGHRSHGLPFLRNRGKISCRSNADHKGFECSVQEKTC